MVRVFRSGVSVLGVGDDEDVASFYGRGLRRADHAPTKTVTPPFWSAVTTVHFNALWS